MSTEVATRLSIDWIGRISGRMRARRFSRFAAIAAHMPRPLTILDVGGRAAFWAQHGWANRSDVRIITGNIESQQREYDNIEPIELDATDMSCFADHSFDIVFSNSVIEHLFTWDNQVKMATEIRRVARVYWVQSPNYWFPIEPHFQFVGWQWLPVSWRVAILRRRTCGWRARTPDPSRARALVEEIRLLTRAQLRRLFPDARLIAERFAGFTKSWMAVRGLM
ncbi:MAG: class I SAM-dependent methyltransferase [Planctomycetota bacterium]